MKAKIFYVGGNTYTLGGVIDTDYDDITGTIYIETANQREGCFVESKVSINKEDVYYIQVIGDDGAQIIIPGVMTKFDVMPTIKERHRVADAEHEHARVEEARQKAKEKNRKRIDAKRAKKYSNKK